MKNDNYHEQKLQNITHAHTQCHIYHDSIYMKCPDQANPQWQKGDQWLPVFEDSREWGVSAYWVQGFFLS